MSRRPRNNHFAWDQVEVAHVWNRVARQCFLLGKDPISGKNYDHRKGWIVRMLDEYARYFGIDLLEYALLSNHFHLILRSRPDVVKTWFDCEVAIRWLLICPKRRKANGEPEVPNDAEINAISNDSEKVKELRRRLSDISWWMRLLSQRIAQKANAEEGQEGRFWQSRFKATKIEDEASLLACSAYVNLNPIRAALAQTVEDSAFTSVQRRLIARRFQKSMEKMGKTVDQKEMLDCHLARFTINERTDPVGPHQCNERIRCSEKGYLPMSFEDYLTLLDWTARQRKPDKRGSTPEDLPPILERLNVNASQWCDLVDHFPRLVLNRPNSTKIVGSDRQYRGNDSYRLEPAMA